MLKEIYKKALNEGFALGAFNFASLEILKAISEASKQRNIPVIAAVSEGAINYLGENYLKGMIEAVRSENNLVYFHLDHGTNFDICKLAVKLGFDSVMIDGSSLPFEQNIAITKKVCEYCHGHKVFVEGELGTLSGQEDEIKGRESIFTNPGQAYEFVKRTGVDSLAVAIGTSHGAYKFTKEAKLDLTRLKEIQYKISDIPLVLHGASSVYEEDVKRFNKFGGELEGAKGVPDKILKEVCTQYHICKVNTDTDLRICYMGALKESMNENKKEIDLRKHSKYAIAQTVKLILKKTKVFGLN